MSKRGVGQPSKFKPEYCEQLVEHMAKGLSFESFGGVAHVSRATLFNWKESHPEFKEAQDVGLERSRIFWEQLGITHVITDKEGPNLNSPVWIFNMKNRFGWRDKQPDEVDKTVVNVGTATEEELKEMARELLKDENNEK